MLSRAATMRTMAGRVAGLPVNIAAIKELAMFYKQLRATCARPPVKTFGAAPPEPPRWSRG